MRRSGTRFPIPTVSLDLSGFRRRQPRAAIAWYLEALAPGELLRLEFASDTNRDVLLATLCGCGGEVISTGGADGGTRNLLVRRSVVRAAEELDMRGARCPAPVIEARRRVRSMLAGEILKLRTDCTGAPAEVNAWTTHSTQVLLLTQRQEGASGHVFLLGRQ